MASGHQGLAGRKQSENMPHPPSIYTLHMVSMSRVWVRAMQDINDTSLCVLMSSITKGCDALNDVVDKVNTAYDKTARRRGGML